MRIAIVLGTRPEIIKMCPIIRQCEKEDIEYFIVHSGQHYSIEMDNVFFEELELKEPKYNIEIGSGTEGYQTAEALKGIEKVLMEEKPDVVLVEGDTNTVLAGALAAVKLGVKAGHVEAGLRSYDRRMPEEINRIMADHVSDYLFCPTEKAREIALGEGIAEKKIWVTGNTIVDSINQNLELSEKKDIIEKMDLEKGNYFLVTAHRKENVDTKETLESILNGLSSVFDKFKSRIIYPIHPRTRKMISEFNLKVPEEVELIDPIGFLEFLKLESNAKLVLTDSGGVQEETCILKIPCVTLRENTERPETLEVGSNMLAGTDPEKIVNAVTGMLEKEREWRNPFGDGTAGKQIVSALLEKREV